MRLTLLLFTVSAGPFLSLVGAQNIRQGQLFDFSGFLPVDTSTGSTTQLGGEDNEVNKPFASLFSGFGGGADTPFTFDFGQGAGSPFTGFNGGGIDLPKTPANPTTTSGITSFGGFGVFGGDGEPVETKTPSTGDFFLSTIDPSNFAPYPVGGGIGGGVNNGGNLGPVNPDCDPGTGVGCTIGDNGGGVNCQQDGGRKICSIVGRPFIDADGVSIASDASTCEVSAWAATATATAAASSSMQDSHHSRNQELGSEWTRRAIGEHASIASFAAFTINLMSNQAPPDLIRDSLNAAMDELNHATTSFDMASLLTGQQIEPGALPPSKLAFDKNLTALALATAREGCIAETLSALEMAVEVDRAGAAVYVDVDDDDDDVSVMLMRKTKTIALEEGRHSALAWRTIHWVCSTDSAACDIVKRQVFEKFNLAGAGKGRSGSQADSDKIEKAWTRTYETLVSFVTMQEDTTLDGAWWSALDCASADTKGEEGDSGGLTGLLVRNIIRGVYCGVEDSSTSPLSVKE
jgi:hypothetical protein